MIRNIEYVGHGYNVIHVEIQAHDEYKIPEAAINKALMIAINYLFENMETTDQKEPE